MAPRFRLGLLGAGLISSITVLVSACSAGPVTDVNGGFGRPTYTIDCNTNPTGQGCACDVAGEVVDCGEIVRRSGDFVTCSQGKRACTGGAWGECKGDSISLHSVGSMGMDGIQIQGFPTGKCTDDPCDPACYTFDQDGGVDAGSNFTNAEGGGITLGVADGSACTGLQCKIVSCDGGTPTTITGTVTDPAGYRPINKAYVYVPNAALSAFPSGVQADPCGGGGTLSGSPIAVTQTKPDGTFTLTNVPPGANIPLVIQVGMWRRQVTIPTVTACAVTNANTAIGWNGQCGQPTQGSCSKSLCTVQKNKPLVNGCDGAQACVAKVCAADPSCCSSAWDQSCVDEVSYYCDPLQCNTCDTAPPSNYGALHLPRMKSEGDMPQIALLTGGCDQFECLLQRIGVDTSEFTTPSGSGKVHMYKGHGGYDLKGGTVGGDTLFGSQAQINKYNMVLLPCDCGDEYSASWNAVSCATAQNTVVSYTNAGGRMFTSHWGRNWIENTGCKGTAPYPGVANWVTDSTCGTYGCSDPIKGYVDTSFAKGNDFAQWLQVSTVGVGAPPFNVTPTRVDVKSVNAPTERWVYGRSDNGGSASPDVVVNMAFNTPLGAQTQYGRVAFSDTHVSSQDGYSNARFGSVFPQVCNPAMTMTPQEKALEYMFFDLGACNTPIFVPPYPNAATFTVDYQGQCTSDKKVVWRFFDWKAVAPGDSSIVFSAQTAATQNNLATATKVTVGTASVANASANATAPAPTSWTGNDVSAKLATLSQKSQAWLRMSITLNPTSNGNYAPTLAAWRQKFDCVDSL